MFCIYQEATGEEEMLPAAKVARAKGGSGSRARASGIRATKVAMVAMVASRMESSMASRVAVGSNPKTKVAKERCI